MEHIDYRYSYYRDLLKVTEKLKENLRFDIIYDVIKLPNYLLPEIDELDFYFKFLEYSFPPKIWEWIILNPKDIKAINDSDPYSDIEKYIPNDDKRRDEKMEIIYWLRIGEVGF